MTFHALKIGVSGLEPELEYIALVCAYHPKNAAFLIRRAIFIQLQDRRSERRFAEGMCAWNKRYTKN
jgi:hypothetical protein